MRPLLSAQQFYEVEYTFDQQSLCSHESRGSIKQSAKSGLDDNQESQRIRDQGQVRLVHTCDSFSESLRARFAPAAQASLLA
jgi:hypothetical protein